MNTQKLLTEVGEKAPKATIGMTKLLRDPASDQFQNKEVVEQLLGWGT